MNIADMPANIAHTPVSIGLLSRQIVGDCLRKWTAGATLSERERAVVDQALVQNRVDALQAVFAEREEAR